jgi:hypothetical protein
VADILNQWFLHGYVLLIYRIHECGNQGPGVEGVLLTTIGHTPLEEAILPVLTNLGFKGLEKFVHLLGDTVQIYT